jgi:hypothetical protein
MQILHIWKKSEIQNLSSPKHFRWGQATRTGWLSSCGPTSLAGTSPLTAIVRSLQLCWRPGFKEQAFYFNGFLFLSFSISLIIIVALFWVSFFWLLKGESLNYFFLVLAFELRALRLLGKHSYHLSQAPSPFYFSDKALCSLCGPQWHYRREEGSSLPLNKGKRLLASPTLPFQAGVGMGQQFFSGVG